jgi:hypothetical protein
MKYKDYSNKKEIIYNLNISLKLQKKNLKDGWY